MKYQVWKMYEVDGMTVAEIARDLKITELQVRLFINKMP